MTERAPPVAPQHPPAPQYWSPPTNGYAIASLVCGIAAMGVGSILALVFGYVAKRQIDESNGMQGGRGLAIAGIVLGWVGVGFVVLMAVVLVVALVVTVATAP